LIRSSTSGGGTIAGGIWRHLREEGGEVTKAETLSVRGERIPLREKRGELRKKGSYSLWRGLLGLKIGALSSASSKEDLRLFRDKEVRANA